MQRWMVLAWAVMGCGGEGAGASDGSTTEALGGDPACERYLDCAAEVTPDVLGALTETYGATGSCWADGADAERCVDACEAGIDDLRGSTTAEACWPSGEIAEGRYDGDLTCDNVALISVEVVVDAVTETGLRIAIDDEAPANCTREGVAVDCDDGSFGTIEGPFLELTGDSPFCQVAGVAATWASPL